LFHWHHPHYIGINPILVVYFPFIGFFPILFASSPFFGIVIQFMCQLVCINQLVAWCIDQLLGGRPYQFVIFLGPGTDVLIQYCQYGCSLSSTYLKYSHVFGPKLSLYCELLWAHLPSMSCGPLMALDGPHSLCAFMERGHAIINTHIHLANFFATLWYFGYGDNFHRVPFLILLNCRTAICCRTRKKEKQMVLHSNQLSWYIKIMAVSDNHNMWLVKLKGVNNPDFGQIDYFGKKHMKR